MAKKGAKFAKMEVFETLIKAIGGGPRCFSNFVLIFLYFHGNLVYFHIQKSKFEKSAKKGAILGPLWNLV